jgi:hypothetical protein
LRDPGSLYAFSVLVTNATRANSALVIVDHLWLSLLLVCALLLV